MTSVDLPSQHLSVCHSAIFMIFGHLNRGVSLQQHRHKLGPGSDGARAAQSLTPPAPRSRGRLGQVTDPTFPACALYPIHHLPYPMLPDMFSIKLSRKIVVESTAFRSVHRVCPSQWNKF